MQYSTKTSRAATLAALVWLLASPGAARATSTVFVRVGGNDAADGLSPATALAGIRTAVRQLDETGGQVIVGPGTYSEGDISLRPLTSLLSPRIDPLDIIADRDGSQTGDPAGPVLVDAAGWPTGFLIYGEANVRIDGFHVRNGSDAGIQVRYNRGASTPSSNVTIANCVVFSNMKRGIDVQDAAGVLIFNNVTYANGSSGISVGGEIIGTSDAVVAQNTTYRNGVFGIFVGAGDRSSVASPNALVLSNVIAGNLVRGVKVAPASQRTFGSAYNVNADGFDPITLDDPTDLEADPQLADPDGADNTLGGTGFADDDFRVQPGSPVVDYGPADVTTLGITGGTVDDDSPDDGTVDAGYHTGNTASEFVVPPVPRAAIYVRKSGSDGNDGTTPAQAFATIRHAASLARGGNRVVVGAGEYNEGDINLQDRSGSQYRPVEFVADPDGVSTGDVGPVVVRPTGNYATGFDILGSRYVTIDGFYVSGGIDSGIQVRARQTASGWLAADHAIVSNSIVFSNRGSGVLVRDSPNATLFNNLVYANGTGGVAIGGFVLGSANARVVNNTVYKNGDHGILIGYRLLDDRVGSPGALIVNNLLDQNGGKSLLVTPLSLVDLSTAANLDSADVGSLAFVDPAGADHVLGGAGFADDDFHLQQVSAGQGTTSVAVDRSAMTAVLFGLEHGSTRTDGVADQGLADLGFHYGLGGGVRPSVETVQALDVRVQNAAASRTLFVAPTGDDHNNGQSPATALRTIRAAARAVMPGDTVVVAPGRYAEGDIAPARPGTTLRPITFVADTAGRASGAAPGPVLIDAAGRYDTGFVLLKRGFIQIRGFHITGTRVAGIQVRPCAASSSTCSSTSGSDHVTIAQNVLFSGRRGIDVVDSTDATIINNLIYANRSVAVSVMGEARSAANTQVINNTFYRNGGDAVLLGGTAGAPNADVIDNVMQSNGGFGIRIKPGSERGLVVDHNINRDGANSLTPRDPNDPHLDPAFVLPAGPDGILGGAGFADDNFRLDVRSSPGIDAAGVDATDVALSAGVARSDGLQDVGRADLGFHYELAGPLAGTTAAAVTLYVRATAGNDTNDGKSPAAAMRTIARAARQAGAGTTIVIGPGTYREGSLRPVASGTATNPIVFAGDADGTQTGDPPGPVVIDAGGASTGMLLAAKSFVRVDGLAVTGAHLAGIMTQGVSNVEIANCRVFSNAGAGLLVVRSRGGNTVFNNLVYANGVDGVQVLLRGVPDTALRIVNNTVYGNGRRGIWIDRSPAQRRLGALLVGHNIVQANAVDLMVTPNSWSTLQVLPTVLSQPAVGMSSAAELTVVPTVFSTPAGSDGVLGGAGFVDDDFRVAAGSVVLDAGIGSAADWSLDQRTVREDGASDLGAVDIGYHYPR